MDLEALGVDLGSLLVNPGALLVNLAVVIIDLAASSRGSGCSRGGSGGAFRADCKVEDFLLLDVEEARWEVLGFALDSLLVAHVVCLSPDRLCYFD